jgi:protease I
MASLSGGRVAFLVANEGIEQVELEQPWDAVRSAGGEPRLVAPEAGAAQAFDHLDEADTFLVVCAKLVEEVAEGRHAGQAAARG